MLGLRCLCSPPLLPGADPHATLIDGAVWIFPTWSRERSRQQFFAFSSTNLIDWQRHGPLLDLAEVPWVAEDQQPWHGAWAPCVLHLPGGVRSRRTHLPIRMFDLPPSPPPGPGKCGVVFAKG